MEASPSTEFDPAAEDQTPRGPNLFVRIGQVFFSPGALFESLRVRPVWLDVVILIIASGIASQALIPEETFRELMAAQMPPDTSPEDMEQFLGFMRRFGIAIAAIWTPLAIAIVSGLLALTYNVLLGGEARYRELFSGTAHSFLILTAGGFPRARAHSRRRRTGDPLPRPDPPRPGERVLRSYRLPHQHLRALDLHRVGHLGEQVLPETRGIRGHDVPLRVVFAARRPVVDPGRLTKPRSDAPTRGE